MEWLSILAGIIELIGIYLLSIRNRFGFIVNLVAGLTWITYTLITDNAMGLLIICPIGLFINTKGFVLWGSKEK